MFHRPKSAKYHHKSVYCWLYHYIILYPIRIHRFSLIIEPVPRKIAIELSGEIGRFPSPQLLPCHFFGLQEGVTGLVAKTGAGPEAVHHLLRMAEAGHYTSDCLGVLLHIVVKYSQ